MFQSFSDFYLYMLFLGCWWILVLLISCGGGNTTASTRPESANKSQVCATILAGRTDKGSIVDATVGLLSAAETPQQKHVTWSSGEEATFLEHGQRQARLVVQALWQAGETVSHVLSGLWQALAAVRGQCALYGTAGGCPVAELLVARRSVAEKAIQPVACTKTQGRWQVSLRWQGGQRQEQERERKGRGQRHFAAIAVGHPGGSLGTGGRHSEAECSGGGAVTGEDAVGGTTGSPVLFIYCAAAGGTADDYGCAGGQCSGQCQGHAQGSCGPIQSEASSGPDSGSEGDVPASLAHISGPDCIAWNL